MHYLSSVRRWRPIRDEWIKFIQYLINEGANFVVSALFILCVHPEKSPADIDNSMKNR